MEDILVSDCYLINHPKAQWLKTTTIYYSSQIYVFYLSFVLIWVEMIWSWLCSLACFRVCWLLACLGWPQFFSKCHLHTCGKLVCSYDDGRDQEKASTIVSYSKWKCTCAFQFFDYDTFPNILLAKASHGWAQSQEGKGPGFYRSRTTLINAINTINIP